MPSRVPAAALVGLLALGLAVGCTDSQSGVATPGSTGSATEESTTSPSEEPSSGSAEPTVEIPERPRELPLDGVEPCSLITQAKATELGFDRELRSYTTGDRYKAPACALEQLQEPFDLIDIMLVTTEGIEPWLTGKRNVDAWPVTVGGYPAVDYKTLGTEDEECVTSVGVADGQQMIVDFQPLNNVDYRELCQKTEQVAAIALQTLQTLK